MKKFNLFLFVIIGFALLTWGAPSLVSAAPLKYFEFAPDSNLSLNIASAPTPYQVFYPQNDFLSGFDLWLSNTGPGGTASFGLRDAQDALLTAKTVVIPYLPEKWGGQTFHIDFDNPVAVSSSALYKIKMLSSMPNLRIYYATRIQLLEHNALSLPIILSIVGPARLGDIDQSFSFKFALYEENDTLPPIIANVTSSIVSSEAFQLLFNTNEPVDYRVTLNPVQGGASQIQDWMGSYNFCNQGILNCGATFSIFPGASYNYEIQAKDYAQNTSLVSGSLGTSTNPPPGNSPPPGTSLVSPPVIFGAYLAALTPRSVKITWQTDKAADSSLKISLDSLGNQIVASVVDTTPELIHTLGTPNVLTPETNYFAILSSGASGASANQILSFKTTAEAQAGVNAVSSQGVPNSNNVSPLGSSGITPAAGGNSPLSEAKISLSEDGTGKAILTIEWRAPSYGEPKQGYRIHIFNERNELTRELSVPAGTHQIRISDLEAGQYRVLIYANQGGILERIAEEATLTIHEKSVSFFQGFSFYVLIGVILILAAIVGFYVIRLKQV
ncbi:MAG: fibronectin type III domain-containing protein [Candidatus Magasanikbacteria bacterium]|nr:fibronectin type III domain-containing protein [Candidatus Magasanikbacteria bacterium]